MVEKGHSKIRSKRRGAFLELDSSSPRMCQVSAVLDRLRDAFGVVLVFRLQSVASLNPGRGASVVLLPAWPGRPLTPLWRAPTVYCTPYGIKNFLYVHPLYIRLRELTRSPCCSRCAFLHGPDDPHAPEPRPDAGLIADELDGPRWASARWLCSRSASSPVLPYTKSDEPRSIGCKLLQLFP